MAPDLSYPVSGQSYPHLLGGIGCHTQTCMSHLPCHTIPYDVKQPPILHFTSSCIPMKQARIRVGALADGVVESGKTYLPTVLHTIFSLHCVRMQVEEQPSWLMSPHNGIEDGITPAHSHPPAASHTLVSCNILVCTLSIWV